MIAAARIGALLLRHWQVALGVVAAALLASLLLLRTSERDAARSELARERAAHALFAARVQARAEEVARRFSERSRRVERDQQRISEEVDRDYQDRITDMRRRADALRVQLDAARRTNPAGAGSASVPGLPGSAGGADGAAGDPGLPARGSADGQLSLEERVIATEQAMRLDALQRWLRAQARIERGPEM